MKVTPRAGLPLSGVRIVAFTQFLLGPAASQLLAGLGADVIKVEPPAPGAFERSWAAGRAFKDGVSLFFVSANRDCRSVVVDLKKERAHEVVEALAKSADVVIQNFRPGVAKRLGIDYESLSRVNPTLIHASATGYGSTGPGTNVPGQDLLVQAVSGLVSTMERVGQPPMAVGASVVDVHGAALLALAIVSGLYRRAKTGEGAAVEVSLLSSALHLQMEPLTYFVNGTQPVARRTSLASGFYEAPYGIYRASDGYVAISLSPLAAVARALGMQTFADDSRDNDAWHTAIESSLRPLTRHAAISRLRAADVWCAPVNTYDELQTDDLIRHYAPFEEIHGPGGTGRYRVLRHPLTINNGRPHSRRRLPSLGEHTDEILRECGMDAEAIASLKSERVVA